MSWPCVLLAGGGTGGHVYPGLAVADEIRRRRPRLPVVFAGTRRGLESRLVPAAGYPLRLIQAGGLAGKSWWVRLGNAARLPAGLLQSVVLVTRERAGVVVGMGGYASGPVVLAGRLLGRPTAIMEQNAVPGGTNKVLAPLVDRVALAFAAAGSHLKGRTVVTGNPVRPGFAALPDARDPERPAVLIFGGSRGAVGLNDAVLAALPALREAAAGWRIIHQTGPADRERVAAGYRDADLDADVTAYIDDMPAAFAAADLLVCRAGATTISELSAAGRAAILIPFPAATGGHQEENARELEARGAALLLRQDEAGGGRLAGLLSGLMGDPGRRRRMESAARELGSPGAAAAVADLVLELYDRRQRRGAAGNGRPA
jgi:UDP-N-acetylglucosamine--N-acetylmuramyl-(pentapeptide) pyrophosphoryl-undecaprenol N-acetylglucosamine transferase